jgi:hypothetical protein
MLNTQWKFNKSPSPPPQGSFVGQQERPGCSGSTKIWKRLLSQENIPKNIPNGWLS